METLEQKVKNALKLQFKDEEIQFHHEPEERIHGFIISEKFEGLDSEARHEMIWSLLHAHLTPEERQQIIGFIDYTPAEEKFYAEAYED
jgi:stress-induced morphogen